MADARHPVSSMYTVVRVRLRWETKNIQRLRYHAVERIQVKQSQILKLTFAN